MLNPFLDNRPIPSIKVNCKVTIKANNSEEYFAWNNFFAYIMNKPRTKIEFITVGIWRNLQISNITIDDIAQYVTQEDLDKLNSIKDIFENRLPIDLKAFILSVLQIPLSLAQK